MKNYRFTDILFYPINLTYTIKMQICQWCALVFQGLHKDIHDLLLLFYIETSSEQTFLKENSYTKQRKQNFQKYPK